MRLHAFFTHRLITLVFRVEFEIQAYKLRPGLNASDYKANINEKPNDEKKRAHEKMVGHVGWSHNNNATALAK